MIAYTCLPKMFFSIYNPYRSTITTMYNMYMYLPPFSILFPKNLIRWTKRKLWNLFTFFHPSIILPPSSSHIRFHPKSTRGVNGKKFPFQLFQCQTESRWSLTLAGKLSSIRLNVKFNTNKRVIFSIYIILFGLLRTSIVRPFSRYFKII